MHGQGSNVLRQRRAGTQPARLDGAVRRVLCTQKLDMFAVSDKDGIREQVVASMDATAILEHFLVS